MTRFELGGGSEHEQPDGVLRRTVLKASAATVAALGMSVPVAADPIDHNGESKADRDVDSPAGFTVDLLAGHATFPDEVAATFRLKYEDGDRTIVSNLPRDASTTIFAKVTWQPEGTSGWYTHPGPVIVSVVEGELELINERDCITRTYSAGEAFIDPGQGNIHIASNPSQRDIAVAYATFLGVPAGAPATVLVPPVACE
ncbi:cupin domain-containing protein [Haloferax sp. KTX1]|uniref:cupin domain-containing protein n=1 Tax=Haloferax sp. KTX1 TaxID=2600597 RepID=UPI0021021659|nr:cupin domain-containing protein [Haloferax sp. KTX1]